MGLTRRAASLVLGLAVIIHACGALEVEVFRDGKKVKSHSDKNAYFEGRSINIVSTIRGVLVYPEPRNACMPVEPLKSNHTSYFALIVDYSACPEFSESHLLEAGFKAMVALTNSSHSELLGITGLPQALIKSRSFGSYLKNHAVVDLSGNVSNVYVKLSEDAFMEYEKLFIIFGSILFAAVILSIVIFCCSICCRAATVKWRTRGLSRWRVSQLPKRKYRKSRETCETCSICLEDFKEGETLRVLPCDHVFHPSCVDEWLRKWNRICPLCKSTIQRSRRGGDAQSSNDAASSEDEDAHLLTNEQPQGETEREGDGYGAVGFSNPLLSSDGDSERESQRSGRVRRSRSHSHDTEHDIGRTTASIELSTSPGAIRIRGDGRSSSGVCEATISFGDEDSIDGAVMV